MIPGLLDDLDDVVEILFEKVDARAVIWCATQCLRMAYLHLRIEDRGIAEAFEVIESWLQGNAIDKLWCVATADTLLESGVEIRQEFPERRIYFAICNILDVIAGDAVRE